MRVVLTGGGTAGHIIPNIAVIEGIAEKTRTEKIGFFYVGSKNPMERKLVEQAGVEFFAISTGKFRRYFSLKNVSDVFKIGAGVVQAYRLLTHLKPDLIFSKGGFVSFPVAVAARLLKIPLWIHESDVSPGMATKLLARFAGRIFLSFPESIVYFPGDKTIVVGNPVRPSIMKGNAERGRSVAGLKKGSPTILIMGGSLGAAAINSLVRVSLTTLLKHAQIIHITGKAHYDFYVSVPGYRVFPFVESELADLYAAADLVVSRAGAGSLFEILACNKPLITIPLPKSVSRGDQIENATVFAQHGWAITLDQDTLTTDEFESTIIGLLKDKQRCNRMIEVQKHGAFTNAAALIVQELQVFANTQPTKLKV